MPALDFHKMNDFVNRTISALFSSHSDGEAALYKYHHSANRLIIYSLADKPNNLVNTGKQYKNKERERSVWQHKNRANNGN